MICEYCGKLDRITKREKLNLASAVLVERAKNYCTEHDKGVFEPSMAGCKEGKLNPFYLDNFRSLN